MKTNSKKTFRYANIAAIILTIASLLSVAGCADISNIKKISPDLPAAYAPPAAPSLSGEELYSLLSRALDNPDDYFDSFDDEITFTAMITSDPFEEQFTDDPEAYVYQWARISRNDDNEFYLNVTDLDYPPENGDIVVVTGEVAGTVYWTNDNKKVSVLDIWAKKIEPLPEQNVQLDPGPIVPVNTKNVSGEFEFLGAHFAKGFMDSDVILIYFKFKNNGAADASPPLSSLYFFQGDGMLTKKTISVKGALSSALPANLVGIPEKTYSGKTQLYFAAFDVSTDAGDDQWNVYVCRWDDDFNQTLEIFLPIYNNSDDMTAG